MKKYIAMGAVILMMTACEKELDFQYKEIDALPVIEASLSQNGAEVTITYTTPMNEVMDTRPVTDAEVSLLDLTTGGTYPLSVDADGSFRNGVGGVVGHDYEIMVTIGAKTYTSECRMLPAVEIQSAEFFWISMPGDDMAALQIRFSDNPLTSDYYWVRTYRNGEAYQWSVINDLAAADGIMEETLTTTHRDESQEDEKTLLVEGDVVTYSVTPISRPMFDYLSALGNSSNGSFNFAGGKALGYFLASPVSTGTIVYSPSDITYAE